MLSGRTQIAAAALALTLTPCVAMAHPRRGPTSHQSTKRQSKGSSKSAKHMSGQRSIDDTRATEIQTALIRSGYLSGSASGHWDAQTEAAMQKFQSDNGWQTKLIPDSRAIIKLGLGPTQDKQAPAATSPTSLTASAFVPSH